MNARIWTELVLQECAFNDQEVVGMNQPAGNPSLGLKLRSAAHNVS